MAHPWDKSKFDSWRNALEGGVLGSKELSLLREMVSGHQATTVEAAADLLDWQETVIDPDEHMYGF